MFYCGVYGGGGVLSRSDGGDEMKRVLPLPRHAQ